MRRAGRRWQGPVPVQVRSPCRCDGVRYCRDRGGVPSAPPLLRSRARFPGSPATRRRSLPPHLPQTCYRATMNAPAAEHTKGSKPEGGGLTDGSASRRPHRGHTGPMPLHGWQAVRGRRPARLATYDPEVGSKQGLSRVRLRTGVDLAFVEQGDRSGPPVLLLHAWVESLRSFDRLIPRLPPALRVWAVDQRGHGDSDRPADGYDLESLAGDVGAFLDAMDVPSAVLVGSSSGGYVAQQVAIGWRAWSSSVRREACRGAPPSLTRSTCSPTRWTRRGSGTSSPGSRCATTCPTGTSRTVSVRQREYPAAVWQESLAGLTSSPPPIGLGTIGTHPDPFGGNATSYWPARIKPPCRRDPGLPSSRVSRCRPPRHLGTPGPSRGRHHALHPNRQRLKARPRLPRTPYRRVCSGREAIKDCHGVGVEVVGLPGRGRSRSGPYGRPRQGRTTGAERPRCAGRGPSPDPRPGPRRSPWPGPCRPSGGRGGCQWIGNSDHRPRHSPTDPDRAGTDRGRGRPGAPAAGRSRPGAG